MRKVLSLLFSLLLVFPAFGQSLSYSNSGPGLATANTFTATQTFTGGWNAGAGNAVSQINNGLAIWNGGQLSWTSSGSSLGSVDLSLARDAADALALRRTTNPQAFRVYNTYTDASNYERGSIRWSANTLMVGPEVAGTGAVRDLWLDTNTGKSIRLSINAGATEIARVNTLGLLFPTDNTYDIGASGATRPRNIYVGTNVYSLGYGATTGGYFSFVGRSYIESPADSILTFKNAAGTAFDRLQFGGSTSSFPSLKRSTTVLQARLADDSAATNIEVLGEAYTDAGWNGDLSVATKDDIRDYFATLAGTYTPTDTANVNLDSATAGLWTWERSVQGGVVTMSGIVAVDATTAASTTFEISLPVASNFADASSCHGTANVNLPSSGDHGVVLSSAANDTCLIAFQASSTSVQNLYVILQYQVL